MWESVSSTSRGVVVEDVDSATEFFTNSSRISDKSKFHRRLEDFCSHYNRYEVLITGSLHLVGNFLSVLDHHAVDDNR
jgi:folylpolyglutamate synthase/dihydropteroate synthase